MANLWEHKFYEYTDEQLDFARLDIANTLQNFQWDEGHNKYINDKLEERDMLLKIVADRKEQNEAEMLAKVAGAFAYAVKVAEAHTPACEHFEWQDGMPVIKDVHGRRWILTAKLGW